MSLYDIQKLDEFIAARLQPNQQFLDSCGEAIDRLVSLLQNNVPKCLRPKRVIKSGSLGKGTAVKERSDIDLVLMLCHYTDVNTLMVHLPELLSILESSLNRFDNVRVTRKTSFSVQVELSCRFGFIIDADILPAVDFDLTEGNYHPNLNQVYQEMKSASQDIMKIHEYSVSLAPLQIHVIKGLPTKLKNLIRLLKYWKDESSTKQASYCHTDWPNSYTMELVAIYAWINADRPNNFEMAKALHAVLTSLVNHKKISATFGNLATYNSSAILPRSTPYIMDPTNPYNDLYKGLFGRAWNWDDVAREARIWLQKAVFHGIQNTELHWQ